MKQDELAAIRERCEAATPGPFGIYVHGNNAGYTVAKFGDNGQDVFWTFVKREDAEFVAYARSDVPALLDEIDRLQAKVRELDDCLHPRYHEDVEKYYALEEEGNVGLAPGYIVCPNKWSHTYHYCTQTDRKDIVSSLCEVGGQIVPMTGELTHWSCSQAYQPIWVATPPKGRRLCKACQRKAEAVKDGDA